MSEDLFDEITEEGFEEYRDFMYENYEMIEKHKLDFIKDEYFTPGFKLERVQELMDFFVLEEEYEKCEVLHDLKVALEVKYIMDELYKDGQFVGRPR